MHKIKIQSASVMVLLLVFVFSILASGCEPLRKKFTRKKKTNVESQEFEPILDPIEYPEKIEDPDADYRYRFSLFRVWQKEFVSGIEDKAHNKRLQYLMNSLIAQLEEMQNLLAGEKSTKLQKKIQVFKKFQAELNQPEAFQDLQSMKRKVRTTSNLIISDFSFSSVEKDIKK